MRMRSPFAADRLRGFLPAIAGALLLLSLEAVTACLFTFRSRPAWVAMTAANLGACLCLVAVFAGKARRSRPLRVHWILLASYAAVWTAGLLAWTWVLFVHGGVGAGSPVVANLSNWLFGCSTIALFVAISLPSSKAYPVLSFSIDTLLYATAGYLAWLVFYRLAPYTTVAEVLRQANLYISPHNVLNVVLTVAALLRVFGAVDGEERTFFQALVAVLLMNTVWDLANGTIFMADHRIVARVSNSSEIWANCLLFGLVHEGGRKTAALRGAVRARAEIFDLANPIFIVLLVLALATYVARTMFWQGITALNLVVLLFGLRATLLQLRFARAQTSLREARDQLEALSLQDALTGVANRRSFDRTLKQEWTRAIRSGDALSLLLIDVDFFKRLNDVQGHQAGDACLIRLARVLQEALPGEDLLARYGGEEFAVILPGTSQREAEAVASALRQAVGELGIVSDPAQARTVTISVGVATMYPRSGSSSVLVQASDEALYRAKQNGRDRVEVARVPTHAGG